MTGSDLLGQILVALAILVVGFVLYLQNEKHFAASQRWLEICTAEKQALIQEVPEHGEVWNSDELYEWCYKEWHVAE